MLQNFSISKKLTLMSVFAIAVLGIFQVVAIFMYDGFLKEAEAEGKKLAKLLFHIKSAQTEFKIDVQE